jgi:threonine/homoserine/homoserine lactone efflux protein
MPSGSTFLLFAGATLLLLALPGPSVLYVVARTVEQGRAAGLVSVLGLETGALIHVGAAAAGVSALVASSPGAFAALRFGGAAYLLWLAARTLLRARGSSPAAGAPASRGQLFRDGVMVDLLNPKTALFFLAFLPGFVRAEAGPVAVQVLLLGLVFVALALLTDGAYALVTARLRGGVRGGRRVALASAGAYALLGAVALSGVA